MPRNLEMRLALAKYQNWLDDIVMTFMYILHEKEGYGEKRLNRVYAEWCSLWFDESKDIKSMRKELADSGFEAKLT